MRLTNPLPGIPLVESPLFLALKPSLKLSEEEARIADNLAQNGFAVLDFPDPELEARIERIKANLSPRFKVDLANPEAIKTSGERRIQDAWKFDADVKAIAVNQILVDLLSKLYGRTAFPFQTLNFPVGTEQEAHTDLVHFSSLPERFMCGVWLAMEDVSADSGPLFYLPGSHRWPAVTNGLIGRRGFNSKLQSAQDPFAQAWRALAEAAGATKEPFLARKGQALIWTANLLHGGSPQHDHRLTRWSQVTHYYFEDCIYYTPAFSDEFVGRLDLRQPGSISEGKSRKSTYLGEVLEQAPPKKLHRMFRRFRKKSVEGH